MSEAKRGRPAKDHRRVTVKLSLETDAAVEAHRQAAGLASWTAALEDLVRRGVKPGIRKPS